MASGARLGASAQGSVSALAAAPRALFEPSRAARPAFAVVVLPHHLAALTVENHHRGGAPPALPTRAPERVRRQSGGGDGHAVGLPRCGGPADFRCASTGSRASHPGRRRVFSSAHAHRERRFRRSRVVRHGRQARPTSGHTRGTPAEEPPRKSAVLLSYRITHPVHRPSKSGTATQAGRLPYLRWARRTYMAGSTC
jgi:hypothetical protein